MASFGDRNKEEPGCKMEGFSPAILIKAGNQIIIFIHLKSQWKVTSLISNKASFTLKNQKRPQKATYSLSYSTDFIDDINKF